MLCLFFCGFFVFDGNFLCIVRFCKIVFLGMEFLDFDFDEVFVDDFLIWVDFLLLYDNVEIDSGDEEWW